VLLPEVKLVSMRFSIPLSYQQVGECKIFK
jgi:hypothetical protein